MPAGGSGAGEGTESEGGVVGEAGGGGVDGGGAGASSGWPGAAGVTGTETGGCRKGEGPTPGGVVGWWGGTRGDRGGTGVGVGTTSTVPWDPGVGDCGKDHSNPRTGPPPPGSGARARVNRNPVDSESSVVPNSSLTELRSPFRQWTRVPPTTPLS